MLPQAKHLEFEQDGLWLTVWFNQPEARNPLTQDRVAELIDLCAVLRTSDMRGVTFRGRGGVFCAGGDLKAFRKALGGGATHEDVVALSLQAADFFDAVAALPQFTVMVVEGAAMAGGFGLACCGDYVIAADNARFGLSEVRVGLTPAQIAPFVVSRLGWRLGRRLMLTGELFDATSPLAENMVDQVVPPEEIDAAIAAIRAQACRNAPGAVAAVKRQMAGLPFQNREDQRQAAASSFADAMLGSEAREGVQAFIDKRKPAWAEE
ncbi:enoyl-CoA hydratase-related protein [Lutimaribacter marinistellae]|uniref:Enoyl-CoA hydratase-related protein n=1 Tax=Lutimaribacter marinistellae TaxID=1820329 RepID=A0ABV7TGV6_9RHOB